MGFSCSYGRHQYHHLSSLRASSVPYLSHKADLRHGKFRCGAQAASSTHPPKRLFGFAGGFSSDYDLGKLVGQGGFGTVYSAVHKRTGERRAVKRMLKRRSPDGWLDPLFVRRILHEVDIYNHIGHSLNTAYLYRVYEDQDHVDLVLELCSGGELWSRIQVNHYTEQEAAKLVREILRTLAQCHARGIIMRDVKPSNFLFLSEHPDAPLKAIDFGMATYCAAGQKLSDKAGSPIYLAPEVLRQSYDQRADIWGAGVIAYQLLTGRLPFSGEEGQEVSDRYMAKQMCPTRDTNRATLYSELDFERPPWDTSSADARELVQSLLQRDPKQRPSAGDALHHRWLNPAEDDSSDRTLSGSIVQRLQRFGTYGRLKQAALRKVAHSIAADDAALMDLQKAFAQMDPEGTGTIRYASVSQALQEFDLSEPERDQLMADLVDNMDTAGQIKYDEWLAAMLDWKSVQDSSEWHDWIELAFKAFDIDGSGSIGSEDLQALLCGGQCMVPDEVDAAIREADLDGDGVINLQEFEEFLTSNANDALDLFETRLKH
ncbi:hypothetical protein WJX84_003705 [Apatococcus fuscideae]|uniref:Uncharacterized protein n=1 Tax=Apatococcus fuscideae TaxID=2026836 RepID=A0AAW1TL12_9CHLO